MNKIIDFFSHLNYKITAPFASGATSLWLLDKIIFSDIEGIKFILAISSVIIFFIASILLYYFLSKLEKEKDSRVVSAVEQIVKYVFADYGQKGVSSGAEYTSAHYMNSIMQTIVNLLKEMNVIVNKNYKE